MCFGVGVCLANALFLNTDLFLAPNTLAELGCLTRPLLYSMKIKLFYATKWEFSYCCFLSLQKVACREQKFHGSVLFCVGLFFARNARKQSQVGLKAATVTYLYGIWRRRRKVVNKVNLIIFPKTRNKFAVRVRTTSSNLLSYLNRISTLEINNCSPSGHEI